ncbi:MAG: DNA topoisomerase III [Opitutales bacterium]|nr:DNA topoisomerase III [Opitutales bacterium]
MKKLIIAEKPSVAADLARALGKVKKTGDYFENEEWVISSAIGHLVELYMPEDFDKKFKSWRMESLPIMPEKFQLKPIAKTKARFNELKKLLGRKDIECVINACDAGREGELIFSYIYELAKKKVPTKRLWMTSMTPDAIKKAFDELKDSEVMVPLQAAAKSRSESDWLIGINGTRAVTIKLFGFRGGKVATVGRVQTPTLALVVQREIEIRDFKPTAFWRITGEFEVANGDYEGVYQKEDFKKNGDNSHDKIDRIWDEEQAKAILAEIKTSDKATVTESSKRTRQSSPRLYDLTTLQREANGRFGFPAGMTLKIAQALYEKHKVLTYPRTDSRALPQDYATVCQQAIENLPETYANSRSYILGNDRINPKDKRVFNNSQISDHFAIIPTNKKPGKLKDEEFKIYDMVVRRFLSVFYPPAEYDVTTRLSEVAGHKFKTEGKVLVHRGWLEAYGRENGKEKTLPALSDTDRSGGSEYEAKVLEVELLEEATKPPPRYTEATLLSAMEGAGKLVTDEDLADAMKEKGLGTPATRASIIDHLIHEAYMLREHKELAPTAKAEELMIFLNRLGVEELTSPALTGEWEFKLRQVEQGKISRDSFMQDIAQLTEKIVENTRKFEEKPEDLKDTKIPSPVDGSLLKEGMRTYQSVDGEFKIYKTIGNRKFTETEITQLLADRKIGPLDGFRSKAGKPYSAMLTLDENHRVKFVFEGNNNGENGNGSTPIEDLKQFPVIGKSPIDEAPVYETPNAYICESYHQDGKGFRLSRSLLGKTIPKEQVTKLLEKGETDLIENFRSNRTKKLFSASLLVDKKGKISFKFPPRPAKGRKTNSGKATENKNDS